MRKNFMLLQPCLEAYLECHFELKWFQKFMKCDIFMFLAISVVNEFNRMINYKYISKHPGNHNWLFEKNKNLRLWPADYLPKVTKVFFVPLDQLIS